MRLKYRDGEEVIPAGNAYYLKPGHIPAFDEDTEVVEFSSRADYQRTLEVVTRNMSALEKGG